MKHTIEQTMEAIEKNRLRAKERYHAMKKMTTDKDVNEHDKKKKLTKMLVVDLFNKFLEPAQTDDTTVKIMKLHIKELMDSGNMQIIMK